MIAGNPQNPVGACGRGQGFRLLHGPAVTVKDGRADGLQLFIHGDHVLHLAAHDDAGDLRFRAALPQIGEEIQKGLPPDAGILLPEVSAGQRGNIPGQAAERLPALRHQHRLDGGGSNIKGRDALHALSLPVRMPAGRSARRSL